MGGGAGSSDACVTKRLLEDAAHAPPAVSDIEDKGEKQMSKYNKYARRVDEIAKENFAAYLKAKNEYRAAQDYYSMNPAPIGVSDAATVARAARAKADYVEKEEAYKKARWAFDESQTKVERIRAELAKAVEADHMANPEALDSNTLELLKSGILKPAEYENLAQENASNPTMLRLIGNYAKQRANEAGRDGDHDTQRTLNVVVNTAINADGRKYLESFDGLMDMYHRCTRNDTMINHWDELTAGVIESF